MASVISPDNVFSHILGCHLHRKLVLLLGIRNIAMLQQSPALIARCWPVLLWPARLQEWFVVHVLREPLRIALPMLLHLLLPLIVFLVRYADLAFA